MEKDNSSAAAAAPFEKGQAAPTYCTRCGELLKGRVVWLSLNCRTGRYSVEPVTNPNEDQGAHPFGVACSRAALTKSGA